MREPGWSVRIVMDQLGEEPNRFHLSFLLQTVYPFKVCFREPDGYVLFIYNGLMLSGKIPLAKETLRVKPITWQQFDWLCRALKSNSQKLSKCPEPLTLLLLNLFVYILTYIRHRKKTCNFSKDTSLIELKTTFSN